MNQTEILELYTEIKAHINSFEPVATEHNIEHYMIGNQQCTIEELLEGTTYSIYTPYGRITFYLSGSDFLYAYSFNGEIEIIGSEKSQLN